MTTQPKGSATKPRMCGEVHGYKVVCTKCKEIREVKRRTLRRGIVSSDLREWILRRDDWTCQYCGGEAQIADHVVASSRGGKGDPDNLIAACWSCNSRKKNLSLKELIERYPDMYGHLRDYSE